VVQLEGVFLCRPHWQQVRRRLAADGKSIRAFTGNILDVLLEAASPGRMLTDEFYLATALPDLARQRLGIVIDMQNTRVELRYVCGQWAALTQTAPAHRRAHLVEVLRRLDARMHELESRLAGLRAALLDLSSST
jgi:hypothetical protein